MEDYNSSVNKNSSNASRENAHGYIPRRCDLNCGRCRYQGICIIPRMLIDTRKRFVRNSILRNRILINNKYRLNDFPQIFGYKKKLFRYLTNLKKKRLYSKD
jgi:hypothetical protein